VAAPAALSTSVRVHLRTAITASNIFYLRKRRPGAALWLRFGIWKVESSRVRTAPPGEALLLAASIGNAAGGHEKRDSLSNFLIIAATQTALADGPAGGAFTTRSCFFDQDT
jgi:hypothetical protein